MRTVLTVAVAALAPALWLGSTGARTAPAAAAAGGAPTSADTVQPELGLPASAVTIFGASGGPSASDPSSAATPAGEAWATGTVGDFPLTLTGGQRTSDGPVLLEHTDPAGWQGVSVQGGTQGQLPGTAAWDAQSGRSTPDGGVALWTSTRLTDQTSLVTVDPGKSTAQIVANLPQPGDGVLDTAETLLPSSGAQTLPFAAVDVGTQTGVLLAPQNDGAGTLPSGVGVLSYGASGWAREPVEDVPAGATFSPLALACGPQSGSPGDSPHNCWMLATVTQNGQGLLTLYNRVSDPTSPTTGEGWVPETGGAGMLSDETNPDVSLSPLGGGAQMLTVTSQGVWVDFQDYVNSSEVDVSEFLAPGNAPGQVTSEGTWCAQQVTDCTPTDSLTTNFPSQLGYLSFAWPGAGGDGERIITGGTQGGLLEFSGSGDFIQQVGTGGSQNAGDDLGGAAFDSPTEGWVSMLGGGSNPDGEGEPQVEEFTDQPVNDALSSDSVPFSSPLLAVAAAPNTTPGDPSGEAIAAGVNGQVAHYVPGSGWTPQALQGSAGQTQTPTLRGVAWPEPTRAYAVGDNGAMWVWQGDTGLWEPDPAKAFNFDENLTGIAFEPGNPDVGWAVGKDGTMLQFGKSWTQATLPGPLQHVDFTSIAFAGDVALATYRGFQNGGPGKQYFTGGLAVNSGSGWVVDSGATSQLTAIAAQSGDPGDTLLSKVAGLPDGAAVAAGPGVVIETGEVTGDQWAPSPQPLPEAANISALAAYQPTGGQVGAIVSIDTGSLDPNGGGTIPSQWQVEIPATSAAGQPPPFEPADPFPDSGYLLEQTASGGWSDMEHMTYPPGRTSTAGTVDVPIRPDPVLALLVNPTGSEGLAVGGQTGDVGGDAKTMTSALSHSETAGVMRFGAGAAASAGVGTSPLSADPSQANFVLGGDAACVAPCAGDSGLSLAPDVSLTRALSEAGQIGGVRDFLYDGGRIVEGSGFSQLTAADLGPELSREATLLSGVPSAPPVHVAPSDDVADAPTGGLGPFLGVLAPFDPGDPSGPGEGYYAFTTAGAAGPVLVIVLDFASDGDSIDATQMGWLATELGDAKSAHEPAIVMGADSLGFNLPDPDTVAPQQASAATVQQLSSTLVTGGASAYLFDYPGANVQTTVSSGGSSIPAFGSGTLGYVPPPGLLGDSLGSSATLVISVKTAARNASTNVAPVTATAIPTIGQLAIDATDGTLLRRSQVALFDGLARRPLEGTDWQTNGNGGPAEFEGPDPYDPIPNNCQGQNCTYQIPEQFTFSSSQPSIGTFVEHDAKSSNPLAVALDKNGLPIPDSSSGLFCAFNQGTTTIRLSAGGLTYSMPVTVQSGSVEYPCGTVPAVLSSSPSTRTGVSIAPIKAPTPRIHPKIHHTLHVRIPPPVVHPQPQPVPHPVHQPAPAPAPAPAPTPVHPHPLPTLPNGAAAVPPVRGIAPAPPAPAARPVPPSGTSQVPSNSSVAENIPAAQKQREKLAATQGVEAMAASDPGASLPIPGWTIALLILATATGAAGVRRRGRDDARFAWVGRPPRAGSAARARTWRRPPPGGRPR